MHTNMQYIETSVLTAAERWASLYQSTQCRAFTRQLPLCNWAVAGRMFAGQHLHHSRVIHTGMMHRPIQDSSSFPFVNPPRWGESIAARLLDTEHLQGDAQVALHLWVRAQLDDMLQALADG